jgi:hypothetical protein
MGGGFIAPVGDTSMNSAQAISLRQGSQFLDMHKDQHGGAAAYPSSVTDSVLTGPMVTAARTAPLDTAMGQIRGMQDGGSHGSGGSHASGPYPTAVTDSVLTGPMIAAARTGPLDAAMAQVKGMQGGRSRYRRKNKSRNAHRSHRSRRSRRSRRSHRSRRHRGGGMKYDGSPLSENSMLLPKGLDIQASLNHEWGMAKDPNAFVPRA